MDWSPYPGFTFVGYRLCLLSQGIPPEDASAGKRDGDVGRRNPPLIASITFQEWVGFQPGKVSLLSFVSFIYLIVFGSLIGFSSYVWLLTKTTTARASTYAYVNPVVAVFLGYFLAGEQLTLRTLFASSVIIIAVVVITRYKSKQHSLGND